MKCKISLLRIAFKCSLFLLFFSIFLIQCKKIDTDKPDDVKEKIKIDDVYEEEAAVNDNGVRYFTFKTDRPYLIQFRVSKVDVDAAESVLKAIDSEANGGNTGKSFGLNKNDHNFNLLYWRAIYNKIYNQTSTTIERLANIFKRIREEQNLNDAETIYTIVRFVQFMHYDVPPGVGIYSPTRVLFEKGKGSFNAPPEAHGTGWNGAGDCDTKSLLMAMLLQACGYQAIVFDSYRYQHAMAGVHCPGIEGSSMQYKGVEYLFVESTYPRWNIGQLPQQYGDITFFHPINPREDQTAALNVTNQKSVQPGDTIAEGQGPSEREPNNNQAEADLIGSLVLKGRFEGDDTADWYRLTGQETTEANFTLIHSRGADFNLEIFNNMSPVGSTNGTGVENVSCKMPGLVHVKVSRVRGAGDYSLYISPGGSVEVEPNDSVDQADGVRTMSIYGELQSQDDVDWYVLHGQEGFNATYTIFGPADNRIKYEIFNDNASLGQRSTGGGNVNLTVEHPGRVTVKISSIKGSGWYLLRFKRNR